MQLYKVTFGVCIAFLLLLLTACATTKPAPAQIDFGSKNGCFLLVDAATGETLFEQNTPRTHQRFSPCSTFKIPLALLAFEQGIFASADTPIPWDGTKYRREAANRDQTPLRWMQDSIVWVSQRIATTAGPTAIESHLARLDYGNRDMSGGLTRFWLESSLEISAREQVTFLRRWWNRELGFSPRTHELTASLLLRPDAPAGLRVYGKTGTGCLDPDCDAKPGRQLGWFVGVCVRDEHAYVFALNFSDTQPRSGYAGLEARGIAMKALEEWGW